MRNVKLIPLKSWAATKFERVPHHKTLQRWARQGFIYPAPRKVGKEWLLTPDAEYVTVQSLVDRLR